MRRLLRIVYAVMLLAVAGFCVFGFMATFEPSDLDALPWRIGYAAAGAGALVIAIFLLWRAARPDARRP